ncbi:phage major capsid protein [Lactobacillus sp. ESL0230]|uniref:phage major capsid protein n=1 Tax=Lactobacillus sp. ESL0230 TaxID=2069353 RepID=UPI000EFDA03D|nr:phage major capsid protein [Lactobacillus sp. ESL0230]RMC46519.1 phage major capsid protein [Lactobacillus sp. ESL0230]
MDINQLHDDWIAKGNKVTDLLNKKIALNEEYNAKFANMSDDEKAVFKDKMKNAAKDYQDAIDARDFAKQTLEDARATEKPTDLKPVEKKKSDKELAKEITDKFVSDLKNIATSGKMPDGTKITGDDTDAGLTIPEDVQTAIHTLMRQFASLANLVNIEKVTTPRGSRVYEKLSDITPLANLDDETAQIGNIDEPKLTLVKYVIHRYAGITTATNTLLADTSANIISWLENWAAKKDVVTRNQAILAVMGKVPAKPTITKFDDIKDLQNNTLDPAIIATSSYVTNQSGFNILSKMKDAEGRYMIQQDVTNPETYRIGGHAVTVVADKWLPDVNGAHPLYFGDLKQGITLYDRQSMSITPTNIGGGAFETDTTKIRFIDRFDVELIDEGAFAAASFKTVADQKPNTSDAKA